jgi:hypothetical protein
MYTSGVVQACTHSPHLEQVLHILDLILCATDGDDPVGRTLHRLVYVDASPRFLSDLPNATTALANDGAGKLKQQKMSYWKGT